MLKSITSFLCLTFLILIFTSNSELSRLYAQDDDYETDDPDYENKSNNLRTDNGKLYAYIVLLYNENPHFVNMIQKGSIPLKVLGIEGFNVIEYKNYLKSLTNKSLKSIAQRMLDIYVEPHKYDDYQLKDMEKILTNRNVILKLKRDRNYGEEKLTLDYCIYGKKVPVNITHPFISIKDKIYNIQPFIYYDELSTSNSTFYFDMIYINPAEVENDSIIAKRVMTGLNVDSLFFVGSRVTDDVKFCLMKAFSNQNSIGDEIWRMFVIHELTHKIMNNNYNNFDQVMGEELSLCSTIYLNSYLGLAILYSYLNYNSINPHRIAAINFIRFCSEKMGNKDIIHNPGSIKYLPENKMKQMARENFNININELKKIK
jgi:hypothetical protein